MNLFRLAPFLLLASTSQAQFSELSSLEDWVGGGLFVALDVDLDGDPDALVADRNGSRLRWFETDASGDPGRAIQIGLDSRQIRFLDVNDADGDGDEDLLVSLDLEPGWLENTGGAFAPFQAFQPGTFANEIQVADMDGDGVDDLLLRGQSGFAMLWLRGLGGGAFDVGLPVASPPNRVSRGRPYDLDGDGDLDYLYSDSTTSNLSILRNDGAWPAYQDVQIMLTLFPMEVSQAFDAGDVDGDGLVDIILSTTDGEYRLDGLGALQFAPRVVLDPSPAGSAQRLLDIDQDGDLDLFGWDFQGDGHWRENVGGSLSTRRPFHTTPGGVEVGVGVFADFDLDGRLDLLAPTSESGGWLRNGGGSAQPFEDVVPLGNRLLGHKDFQVADFDGDSDLDIAHYRGPGVGLLLNDGAGSVDEAVPIAALPDLPFSSCMEAGDFNGDGAQDLLVEFFPRRMGVYFGTGKGSFAPFTEIPWADTARVLEISEPVDLDGDGALDLLMVTAGSSSQLRNISWSQNDGTGVFAAPTHIVMDTQQAQWPLLVDLDVDGHLDLMFRAAGFQDVFVKWGLPGGAFETEVVVFFSRATTAVAVADLDADGDLDLVRGTFFGGPQLVVHELQGRNYVVTSQLPAPSEIARIVFVDAGGDGDLDVVATTDLLSGNGLAPLVLYEQSAPLALAGPQDIAREFPSGTGVRVVDWDRDGDEDLVWVSEISGDAGVLSNLSLGPIGSAYCSDAIPNSTGVVGTAAAAGSDEVSRNALTLSARSLPPNSFGIFAASRTQDSVLPVQNSVGRLCLGGFIVRLDEPGQIGSSGTSGQFFVHLDLNAIPGPSGPIPVSPGETWNFQAWHRDIVMGAPTSNYTTAVSVVFR